MGIYDITVVKGDGTEQKLSDFKGKVLLIVNSATHCGFTPHYEDLKQLHNSYEDKGLIIMDFPCNQFGDQAPGSYAEITDFCTLNYNLPYKLFAKTEVNGENESELFKYLKSKKGFEGFKNEAHPIYKILTEGLAKENPTYADNDDIKWNFTKFLVDREGNVVARFEPLDEMSDVESAIKELL